MFSHYRFRWAASGTVGELAFVEVDRGGGMERLVLTDAPALAAEQAGRLSPRAWETGRRRATAHRSRPSSRRRWRARRWARRSSRADLRIEVEVVGPRGRRRSRSGPAPRVPTEDIVSVLIEAGSGSASIDGRPVAGRPVPQRHLGGVARAAVAVGRRGDRRGAAGPSLTRGRGLIGSSRRRAQRTSVPPLAPAA